MNKKVITVIVAIVILLLAVIGTVLLLHKPERAVTEVERLPVPTVMPITDVPVTNPTPVPRIDEIIPVETVDSTDSRMDEALYIIENEAASTIQSVYDLFDHETGVEVASIFEDEYTVTYVYSFNYTDVELYCTRSKQNPSEPVFVNDPSNKYGSDYAEIFFVNGVPDNSFDIYNAIYEQYGHFSGITEYVGGDTVTLLDKGTNELVLITLD